MTEPASDLKMLAATTTPAGLDYFYGDA